MHNDLPCCHNPTEKLIQESNPDYYWMNKNEANEL